MSFVRVIGARPLRALASIGVIAATAILVSPAISGAQSGSKLFVNASTGSDVGACPKTAPCATIAYALTQAASGSTIHVAAGSYPQQLVINKSVSIVGAANPTIIDPPTLPVADTDTDSPLPQYAIVDVTSGATVNLTKLTIDGQPAQGQFTSCADDFVGVYYHDASGSMTSDTVTNVELAPALFGCQDGLGVYVASDASDTSSVSMSNDVVNNYDKNGITCDDAGTICSITGSTVTGIGPTGLIAQNGVQFYDALGGSVMGNTVSGDSYTGGFFSAAGLLLISTGTLNVSGNTVSNSDVNVYLGTDGTGPAANIWSVTGNTVTGATDKVPGGESGLGDGIQLDSTSNPVTIKGNTVTGGAENGISVFSASGATLSKNTTSHNQGDGIYIGGPGSFVQSASTGNTISSNTVQKNGEDGILADINSASNQFSGNTLTKNVRYDIDDQGTANTWTGNTCTPAGDSNPAGLC
jgi:parallel beta-helix repeat protein